MKIFKRGATIIPGGTFIPESRVNQSSVYNEEPTKIQIGHIF